VVDSGWNHRILAIAASVGAVVAVKGSGWASSSDGKLSVSKN
jgi:hypothetical protein